MLIDELFQESCFGSLLSIHVLLFLRQCSFMIRVELFPHHLQRESSLSGKILLLIETRFISWDILRFMRPNLQLQSETLATDKTTPYYGVQ